MTVKQTIIVIGIGVVLVGAIVGLGYYVYKTRHERSLLQSLLDQTNEQLHSANLELGRARTREGDAEAMISKLQEDIRKEIQQRNATLIMYAELQTKYIQVIENVKTITKIVYEDKIIDLPKGKIFFRDGDGVYKEVTSLTYNYEDYHLKINGDAIKETLSYELSQKFHGVLAKTKMKDGSYDYYMKLSELGADGKPGPELQFEKFEVIETSDKPVKKMNWFDPYLDGYFGVTYSDGVTYTGEVGLSLMSFGYERFNTFFRFIRLGAGITNGKLSLSFSPAQINFGRFLSPLSNLWLVPIVGWNFGNATYLTGIGVSVVF